MMGCPDIKRFFPSLSPQQLCRDWSRSSKKLETKATNPTTAAVKKSIQQRDSKDSECSNRSSTSSW